MGGRAAQKTRKPECVGDRKSLASIDLTLRGRDGYNSISSFFRWKFWQTGRGVRSDHSQLAMHLPRIITAALSLMALISSAVAEPVPLRVGVIAPMSGEFASYGLGVFQAMDLANQQSSDGRLTLEVEDNRSCQSGDAVSAFHKLNSTKAVDVLVTFCTGAAQGVLPLAKARKIPLIQLTEPGADGDNYMLKVMPDSAPGIEYLATYFAKKYSTIALVGNIMEVNTGPRGNLPLFRDAFEKQGGKVVLLETFPDSETDFKSIVLKVRASGAEAVSPFIWSAQQMSLFLREGDRIHLWSKVSLAGNVVFDLMFSQILPLYPRLKSLDGLESINFAEVTEASFIKNYKEKFGEGPPQFADYAYDVVEILKECGSDRSCMRRPRVGVSGQVTFDSTDRRLGTFVLKRLREGKFEDVPEMPSPSAKGKSKHVDESQ